MAAISVSIRFNISIWRYRYKLWRVFSFAKFDREIKKENVYISIFKMEGQHLTLKYIWNNFIHKSYWSKFKIGKSHKVTLEKGIILSLKNYF